MITRCYSELSKLRTFKERYQYLRLGGIVGEDTFGSDRYLNQYFYKSPTWLKVRDEVIDRDKGCDLGLDGWEINDKIYVHHMTPITKRNVLDGDSWITDPEYLICCSFKTHQAITFGDINLLPLPPVQREPGDTLLWGKMSGGNGNDREYFNNNQSVARDFSRQYRL